MQPVAAEVGAQRLGAQAGQQRVARTSRLPEQAAEAARVVQTQALPALQHDIHMVVLAQRRIGGDHTQLPRHAQVQQGGTRLHIEQQVFGPPPHRCHRLAGEQGRQFVGHRPAQRGIADNQGVDAPAFHRGRDAATRGFDFGQFRHGQCALRGAQHSRAWPAQRGRGGA